MDAASAVLLAMCATSMCVLIVAAPVVVVAKAFDAFISLAFGS